MVGEKSTTAKARESSVVGVSRVATAEAAAEVAAEAVATVGADTVAGGKEPPLASPALF